MFPGTSKPMNSLLFRRVFAPLSGGRVPLILPATAFSLGGGPVLDGNGIDSPIYDISSNSTGGDGGCLMRRIAEPEPSAALLGSIGLIALLRCRSATRANS